MNTYNYEYFVLSQNGNNQVKIISVKDSESLNETCSYCKDKNEEYVILDRENANFVIKSLKNSLEA